MYGGKLRPQVLFEIKKVLETEKKGYLKPKNNF